MAHLVSGRIMTVVRQCRPPAVRAAAGGRSWAPPRRMLAAPLSAAAEGNNISSALMEQMRSKIQQALNAETVQVEDMQGDGRHVEIVVVSKEFEGKSAVNRQRMVYKAIWEELQETVHAVDAMVTKTPGEMSS